MMIYRILVEAVKILCCFVLINGCAMADKLYPLPERDVVVNGDKIYHNNIVFAELRYLGKPGGQWYQGLAIFYHTYNKEVWIFPKEGWHFHIVEENKKYSTIPRIKEQLKKAQEEGILFNRKRVLYTRGNRDFREFKPMPAVYDVHISENGQYVFYKTKDTLLVNSHKYLVEYGASE